MQCKWPAIGMRLDLAVPIHLIAFETRFYGKKVSFVRPPTVDAQRLQREMLGPVWRSIAGSVNSRACIGDLPMKIVGRDDMKHYVEVIAVKFAQHLLRVREYIGIECEGPVTGIPTGGAESSAQVDQTVTGQLLFSKCPGNA